MSDKNSSLLYVLVAIMVILIVHILRQTCEPLTTSPLDMYPERPGDIEYPSIDTPVTSEGQLLLKRGGLIDASAADNRASGLNNVRGSKSNYTDYLSNVVTRDKGARHRDYVSDIEAGRVNAQTVGVLAQVSMEGLASTMNYVPWQFTDSSRTPGKMNASNSVYLEPSVVSNTVDYSGTW